jgi:hypothetical protein
MNRFFLPGMLALSLLAGCAPKLKFEPVHPVAVSGHGGGTTKSVGGVTFYMNGAPARKYTVIGYLNDYRLGENLDERDLKEMAPMVRAAGATTAIVLHGGNAAAPGLKRGPDETGPYVLRVQVVR